MSKKLITWLLILATTLSGCSMPTSNNEENASDTSAVHAWFDAPLPNSIFYPPNPICQIVAHGASPNGIASFELSINGAAVEAIPSTDTKGSLVTLTRDCGLTESGEYMLQIRAQDNAGEWSGFAETSLIIAAPEGDAMPPVTESPVTEPPSTEPPIPTDTPTTEPTGNVSVERVSTNLVSVGSADCGPMEITFVANATAPKGIKVVVLFYRFEPGNSSGFESASMNSIGGSLYQGSINPTSLFGGSPPFDQATLQYQVVVQQNDGDTSIRTPLMADIVVQSCGNQAPEPVTIDCSSYTDQRACIANGCNWVNIPGSVPIYACQNP